MKQLVRGCAVVIALSVGIGAAGCSSSDSAKTDSSSSEAPEDLRTTPAKVAAGLKVIDTTAKGIADAAGTDKDSATALVAKIEPAWQPIEGTVKGNDPDVYLKFEDAFAVLEKAVEDGDAAKAKQGADDVTATVTAYVAKYPG